MKKNAYPIYLLLGSNMGAHLGHREAQLSLARTHIASEIGTLHRSSSLYETAPWGDTEKDNGNTEPAQDPFLNQALELSSALAPLDLLQACQRIEQRMKRKTTRRWGPRCIDLDILYYERLCMDTPRLCIPHPRLPMRLFALVPMAELAFGWVHPVCGRTQAQLVADCRLRLSVRLHA